MNLQGPAAAPTTIDLYGVFGSFRIVNSPFDIKYVSTFARASGIDGHATLLRELKPMRERLDASALTDLSSLLQRDLSDRRVAGDLVPYLLGQKNSEVGFFPAILAVIVPNDYLKPGTNAVYPRPIEQPPTPELAVITKFEDRWETVRYSIDNNTSPLGMIKVAIDRTQIIVLDGQHRTNAFRYLSGAFNPQDSIYQTFYSNAAEPQHLDAELPVTLIWFEAEPSKSIDPKIISRRLFVDVNNTPKPVSAARTILLDDRTVTALGTQTFYNDSAQRGFKPGSFSLLHGAFDMDADLARSNMHRIALTAPEIVDTALSWGLFGTLGYDGLGTWNATRAGIQRNKSRFAQIFPTYSSSVLSEDQDERTAPYFDSQTPAQKFRDEFANIYFPVLRNLFSSIDFLKPHYDACQMIKQWRQEQADTTVGVVWDKVFCGGEGLYWVFAALEPDNPRAREYRLAITTIENRFTDERARLFGVTKERVDVLYDAFCSKAFQSGYVGAVDHIARTETGDYLQASDQLVSRLNNYSLPNWGAVFYRLRPLVIDGTDPKKWPSYRNILLRFYDGNVENIYSASNLEQSPDWKAYENRVVKLGQALDTADQMPDADEQNRLLNDLFDEVQDLLKECGLDAPWFDKATVVRKGLATLRPYDEP